MRNHKKALLSIRCDIILNYIEWHKKILLCHSIVTQEEEEEHKEHKGCCCVYTWHVPILFPFFYFIKERKKNSIRYREIKSIIEIIIKCILILNRLHQHSVPSHIVNHHRFVCVSLRIQILTIIIQYVRNKRRWTKDEKKKHNREREKKKKFMRMEQDIHKKLSPHSTIQALYCAPAYPTLKSLRYFSFLYTTHNKRTWW
jgi:hypothetical protein